MQFVNSILIPKYIIEKRLKAIDQESFVVYKIVTGDDASIYHIVEVYTSANPNTVHQIFLQQTTQGELDDLADWAAKRDQIKSEYLSTMTTLQQIEDTQSPTNAQVVAAVKFLAKTLRILLRFLARQFS